MDYGLNIWQTKMNMWIFNRHSFDFIPAIAEMPKYVPVLLRSILLYSEMFFKPSIISNRFSKFSFPPPLNSISKVISKCKRFRSFEFSCISCSNPSFMTRPYQKRIILWKELIYYKGTEYYVLRLWKLSIDEEINGDCSLFELYKRDCWFW